MKNPQKVIVKNSKFLETARKAKTVKTAKKARKANRAKPVKNIFYGSKEKKKGSISRVFIKLILSIFEFIFVVGYRVLSVFLDLLLNGTDKIYKDMKAKPAKKARKAREAMPAREAKKVSESFLDRREK